MFVDTNVFVQARFTSAPFHARARAKLDEIVRSGVRLKASRQILREYLAVTTRLQAWATPMPTAEAARDIQHLLTACDLLEEGPAVTTELLELCRTVAFAGRRVHDAKIVATMLAHGEPELLTFNTADFVRFAPAIKAVAP